MREEACLLMRFQSVCEGGGVDGGNEAGEQSRESRYCPHGESLSPSNAVGRVGLSGLLSYTCRVDNVGVTVSPTQGGKRGDGSWPINDR